MQLTPTDSRVLSNTADLKTSACTSASTPPPGVRAALKHVPSAIKAKFYGVRLAANYWREFSKLYECMHTHTHIPSSPHLHLTTPHLTSSQCGSPVPEGIDGLSVVGCGWCYDL
jgi:hypothetical protein